MTGIIGLRRLNNCLSISKEPTYRYRLYWLYMEPYIWPRTSR